MPRSLEEPSFGSDRPFSDGRIDCLGAKTPTPSVCFSFFHVSAPSPASELFAQHHQTAPLPCFPAFACARRRVISPPSFLGLSFCCSYVWGWPGRRIDGLGSSFLLLESADTDGRPIEAFERSQRCQPEQRKGIGPARCACQAFWFTPLLFSLVSGYFGQDIPGSSCCLSGFLAWQAKPCRNSLERYFSPISKWQLLCTSKPRGGDMSQFSACSRTFSQPSFPVCY